MEKSPLLSRCCEGNQALHLPSVILPVAYQRIYYINTEKYSPKSYVVNFRTKISSSQSEERTTVFTRQKKKNDTSNKNGERCFFTCEKNDTSNQKPQRCVNFAPKFPPFQFAACSAASHTFNDKSFTERVFSLEK